MNRPLAMIGVALALEVTHAQAAPPESQACFDAALRGQKLERDGKLLGARDAFATCAQAGCPEPVTKQCTAWLVGVDEAMPTITLEARDPQGRDLVDATVTIDDGKAVRVAEGRDVPLDPGPHTLRWTRGSAPTLVTTVVLREHEKGRHVLATFGTQPVRGGPPALGWVLGGTSIAATGVFLSFGIKGYADRQSFGCDRACTASEGSQVRREFVTADVALGVAALSLAGALWLFLAPRHDAAPRSDAPRVVARF